MSLEIWIYYLLAVLVLTASPGPSSIYCMTSAVTSGWKAGFFTALGSLCAITLILSFSFTGLGVIVASSEITFTIIKWLGACYLIFLGIKSLLSKAEDYSNTASDGKNNESYKGNYISGFIVGASNPKAILFFTALFPQFINPDTELLPQYLVFASTFVVLELFWLMFYTYLGATSSKWLMAKGRAKLFNRLTGSVFIGAGVLVSTASRN
jgi:threonine/homoserine/homoserine lactone efflux protein